MANSYEHMDDYDAENERITLIIMFTQAALTGLCSQHVKPSVTMKQQIAADAVDIAERALAEIDSRYADGGEDGEAKKGN